MDFHYTAQKLYLFLSFFLYAKVFLCMLAYLILETFN